MHYPDCSSRVGPGCSENEKLDESVFFWIYQSKNQIQKPQQNPDYFRERRREKDFAEKLKNIAGEWLT